MDNDLNTKNKITENNNWEIKYLYSFPIKPIGINKYTNINILAYKYGDKPVDLISNPVIIFELGDMNLEFVAERIFSEIKLVIGEFTIDKICQNQITVLQKKYDLAIKKIGSKVFFPLPINCLLKSNGIIVSKCNYNTI